MRVCDEPLLAALAGRAARFSEWRKRMIRKIAASEFMVVLALVMVLLLGTMAVAQSAQLQGIINGRSGATMTVQGDSGNVVVLLTPATDVQEVQGVFHARKKE